MKILIIGERFSENLGDPLLCLVTKKIIEKIYDDSEIDILDISGRTGYGTTIYKREKAWRRIFNVIPILRLKNSTGKKELKLYFEKKVKKGNYDLILFAGGQLFISFFYYPISYIVSLAEKEHMPVFFNACGSGKFESKFILKKMNDMLNNNIIKGISLRESKTEFENNGLHSNKRIIETIDTAILSSEFYGERIESTEYIGVGVIYIGDFKLQSKYEELIKKICYVLYKRNIQFSLFCNGNIYDYQCMEKIKKEIEESLKANVKIEERPKNEVEIIKLIRKFKGIISFRLHSHIISASYNIPTVGIEWDTKVRAFFKQMGREEYCYRPDSSPNDMVDKLIYEIDEAKVNYYPDIKKISKMVEENLQILLKGDDT